MNEHALKLTTEELGKHFLKAFHGMAVGVIPSLSGGDPHIWLWAEKLPKHMRDLPEMSKERHGMMDMLVTPNCFILHGQHFFDIHVEILLPPQQSFSIILMDESKTTETLQAIVKAKSITLAVEPDIDTLQNLNPDDVYRKYAKESIVLYLGHAVDDLQTLINLHP